MPLPTAVGRTSAVPRRNVVVCRGHAEHRWGYLLDLFGYRGEILQCASGFWAQEGHSWHAGSNAGICLTGWKAEGGGRRHERNTPWIRKTGWR
jgi:hypothetical protein